MIDILATVVLVSPLVLTCTEKPIFLFAGSADTLLASSSIASEIAMVAGRGEEEIQDRLKREYIRNSYIFGVAVLRAPA